MFCTQNFTARFHKFQTPNELLPNMTFVPYFKGFPAITHNAILDLPCVSFEDLFIYVQFGIFMMKLNVQASSLQNARPITLQVNSARFCTHHWASHAPVQAHAYPISNAMHTREA